jgi:hypothetical protein
MKNEEKPKLHLQNVIGWLLLYTAGFMTFSMFMYVIDGSDKWFSRLFLAVVSAGLGDLLRRD